MVTGDLKPGQTLPTEPELSQNLGVSRTVVREAIKSLAEKGMIVSRPKTGTQILPRSAWNVLDPDILNWEYQAGPRDAFLYRLTEVRLIVEPAASEMAAQRATEDEIAAMFEAYREMTEAVDDVDSYIDADMRLHAAILRAAHNDLLERVVSVIRTALISSRKVTVQVPGSSRAALPLHLAVVEAIANHQPRVANEAMRNLISRARTDIDALIGPEPAHSNESPVPFAGQESVSKES